MTCRKCGSACQGRLCRQCEIERQFEHQKEQLSADSEEGDDGE